MRSSAALLALLLQPVSALADQLILEVGSVHEHPFLGRDAFVEPGVVSLSVLRDSATLRIEATQVGAATIRFDSVPDLADQTLDVAVVRSLAAARTRLSSRTERILVTDLGTSLVISGDTVRYRESVSADGQMRYVISLLAPKNGHRSSILPSSREAFRSAKAALTRGDCVGAREGFRSSTEPGSATNFQEAQVMCAQLANDALALAKTYRENGMNEAARSTAERVKRLAGDPQSEVHRAAEELLASLPSQRE